MASEVSGWDRPPLVLLTRSTFTTLRPEMSQIVDSIPSGSNSNLNHDNTHKNIGKIHDDDKRTPLPMAQLISVFLIQGTEPVTATVIYPFINQFIRETGITNGNEAKTGYYAGIIVRQPPATSVEQQCWFMLLIRNPFSFSRSVWLWYNGATSQTASVEDPYCYLHRSV